MKEIALFNPGPNTVKHGRTPSPFFFLFSIKHGSICTFNLIFS
uniref:Uncharacterized protein n=1 Tax=Rhizophora mucronata TaxID=61149 RepID=A0A2P2R3P5_RHIMU